MDDDEHFALQAYRLERDRRWLERNAAQLRARAWAAKAGSALPRSDHRP